MTTSTIPDAVDALVAMCKAAVTGGSVFDGPPNGAAVNKLAVCIAYTGSHGEVAITDKNSLSGPSLGRALERYEITSQVSGWAGNGEISAQRRRVYGALDEIKSALIADKTLGGAVAQALYDGADYAPSRETPGPTVAVNFTVRIDAYERAAA